MNAAASRLVWGCLILFATGVITSCATNEVRWVQKHSYDLRIADNTAERRFDLLLTSSDAKALCLVVEQWPNRAGLLHMGSGFAALQTEKGVLPALDDNFGYCPGGCGQHRIEPHGELRGFIAYEAFGDPAQLAADTGKQLEFSVRPFYCRRR